MNAARLSQLFEFLKEDDTDPFPKYAIGLEYLDTDPAEALRWLERTLREHPAFVGTYYQTGKLYESLAQPDRARHLYERGLAAAAAAADRHATAELRAALRALDEEEEEW